MLKNILTSLKQKKIKISILILSFFSLTINAQHTVSYVGGNERERFGHPFELRNSSKAIVGYLVPGYTNNDSWIPSTANKITLTSSMPIISTPIPASRKAIILHLSVDLKTILNVIYVPLAQDVYKIKTTTATGEATGEIFISGQRNTGYYIARLNNNFVNSIPSNIDMSMSIGIRNGVNTGNKIEFDGLSYHQTEQSWDVQNDGKVVCASGGEFAFDFVSVQRFTRNGSLDVVKSWPQSYVIYDSNGVDSKKTASVKPQHGANPTQVWAKIGSSPTSQYTIKRYVSSELVMKIVGTGNRGLYSNNVTDFNRILADENDNLGRQGTYPNDIFTSMFLFDTLAATDINLPQSKWGYSITDLKTQRIGDITIDKRNNDMYIGYTTLLNNKFGNYVNDPAFKYGIYDYESTVMKMDSTGLLHWWAQLHKLDSNKISTNNHFINDLDIDYTNNKLVVLAWGVDTTTNNFWKGNELKEKIGGNGFKNQFTGTNNLVLYSWLAKYKLNPGGSLPQAPSITDATYIGEYTNTSNGSSTLTGTNMDNWTNPNTGNPNIDNTLCKNMYVDKNGNVAVNCKGTRVITTAKAFQKTYKMDKDNVLDSNALQLTPFVRIYNAGLNGVLYSSLLANRYNPLLFVNNASASSPILTSQLNNLEGLISNEKGLLVGGYQASSIGVPLNRISNNIYSKLVKTTNSPAWASDSVRGESAFIAQLDTAISLPSEPISILKPASHCKGETKTYSIAPVVGATSYKWMITNATSANNANTDWTGISITNSINITSNSTATSNAYLWVSAINANGEGSARVILLDKDNCPTGIFNTIEESNSISIYPNPIENTATIIADNINFANVQVLDITGRVVSVNTIVEGKSTLDLSSLPKGVYLVKISSDKLKPMIKKIIKN